MSFMDFAALLNLIRRALKSSLPFDDELREIWDITTNEESLANITCLNLRGLVTLRERRGQNNTDKREGMASLQARKLNSYEIKQPTNQQIMALFMADAEMYLEFN